MHRRSPDDEKKGGSSSPLRVARRRRGPHATACNAYNSLRVHTLHFPVSMRIAVGLLSLVVACGSTGSESVGGDGEDVAPLLAGRVVPEAEIARDLRAAGFAESEIPQMVCAAKYESSFYAQALHKNHNGSIDYGLFQINDDLWAHSCGLTVQALYDPAKNAKCARKVYDSGGIRSWYAYRKHQTECDRYTVNE